MEIDEAHREMEDDIVHDIRIINDKRIWTAKIGPPGDPPEIICELCGNEDCRCPICESCGLEAEKECSCVCELGCDDYKKICGHYEYDDLINLWLTKGDQHGPSAEKSKN